MPADEHVTRCDLRIPNELYTEIESLAAQSGASIHHRSGKTIVTPTILKLIKLGLERGLSDKASDNLPDSHLIDEKIQSAIAPLISRLEKLEAVSNTHITKASQGASLDLTQAYELARSRNYLKSKDAFRKALKRELEGGGKGDIEQMFGIVRGELHNTYFDIREE